MSMKSVSKVESFYPGFCGSNVVKIRYIRFSDLHNEMIFINNNLPQ